MNFKKSIPKNLIKTLNDKPEERVPAILKCKKCGTEWENGLSSVLKGSEIYIESECLECKIKSKKIRDQNRLILEKELRLEKFDSILPTRYRGKIKNPIHLKLLNSCCSVICGEFGTGKTWEAYAIGRKLTETGEIRTFKFVTEVGILNDLKDGFDQMTAKMKYYKNIDLLVIDESGKNNDSDFNKAQLFEILNYRYDWEKRTILLCNVKTKNELLKVLPTATMDRFRETIILMEGKSLRYKEF